MRDMTRALCGCVVVGLAAKRAADFGASSKAFVDESVLVVYTQPGDLPLEGCVNHVLRVRT